MKTTSQQNLSEAKFDRSFWNNIRQRCSSAIERLLGIQIQRLDLDYSPAANEVIFFDQSRGTIRVVEFN